MQRLVKRSAIEDCNKAQVDEFWKQGLNGAVPGMAAVVCYNSAFYGELQSLSADLYRQIPGDHVCTHKREQIR